jgi:ribosomal protein S18 acetylase RimI-like enzyme
MIVYRDGIAGIGPPHLLGFFEGWPNPPKPETHLRLLACSDELVQAWDNEADRVVGYSTAITDGVLSAYIPLLEVLTNYRGRGIGSELLRRMLAKLEPYYMVDLVCDPRMAAFYERYGMTRATAMVFRQRERQAGIRSR